MGEWMGRTASNRHSPELVTFLFFFIKILFMFWSPYLYNHVEFVTRCPPWKDRIQGFTHNSIHPIGGGTPLPAHLTRSLCLGLSSHVRLLRKTLEQNLAHITRESPAECGQQDWCYPPKVLLATGLEDVSWSTQCLPHTPTEEYS